MYYDDSKLLKSVMLIKLCRSQSSAAAWKKSLLSSLVISKCNPPSTHHFSDTNNYELSAPRLLTSIVYG